MPADPIPPLLSPYIRIPPIDSLILSTYVLGALNNWLLVRYLHACLGKSSSRNGFRDVNNVPQESEDDVAVVLVSWMRDFAFWKVEARRAVGLDLPRLQQQCRFAFIDGLSKLFHGATQEQAQHRGHTYLTDASMQTLESTITASISTLDASAKRIILILDTPTLPLSIDPSISGQDCAGSLLTLRSYSRVSACVVSCPVDEPFVVGALHATLSARAASDTNAHGAAATPLESVNSAVIAHLAQQAAFVVGTRRLGTGWARDVSGVLRVTRGGAVDEVEASVRDGGERGGEVKEGEWLYFVEGDASVRVWGRGSGVG